MTALQSISNPPTVSPLMMGTLARPQALPAPMADTAVVSATPAPEPQKMNGFLRGALITAGVVGGAVVAGALAYATLTGGTQLGVQVVVSLYREILARQLSFYSFIDGAQKALTLAPLAGALAGGVTMALATSENPNPDQPERKKGLVSATWAAYVNAHRESAAQIKSGVQGIGSSDSLGGAIKSGASAGWALGNTFGGVGGMVQGAIGGIYLGLCLAGAPFTFAPMTSIPLALLGMLGGATAGRFLAGAVAGGALGAVGGVVGAVGHGIKKLGEDK